MPTDSELLAQLNQKLDSFILLYERRHADLEKRIDKNEQRIEYIENEIKGLHNSSMQFVNEIIRQLTDKFTASLQELERRISDRIDANSKFSLSNWVLIGLAAIGWIISIVAVIVAIFK